MQRKRAAFVPLVLLATIVAVLIGRTWLEVQQIHLNQALIYAVDRNDMDTALSLLRQGADPNARILPDDKRSSWRRAWDVLLHQFVRNPVAKECALLRAVSCVPGQSNSENARDNAAMAEILIDAGANVNVRDNHSDLNGKPSDDTPLIMAALASKWKTLHVLLAHNADVNAANSFGFTTLMIAASHGKADVIDELLKEGAKVNAKDIGGQTALFYVLEAGPYDITVTQVRETVTFLLRYGASVNTKDDHSNTAMFLARDVWNDKRLLQMLRQAGARE